MKFLLLLKNTLGIKFLTVLFKNLTNEFLIKILDCSKIK